jgi:hypothetical protein
VEEPDDFDPVWQGTIKNQVIPKGNESQVGRKFLDTFAEIGLGGQQSEVLVELVQKAVCSAGII